MHRVEVRLVRERPAAKVRSPNDVWEFLKEKARSWPQERFLVLHLDTQHWVRHYETVTVGTLDSSIIHPREVFRGAILTNSAAILLAHNHPSGDPAPSPEDRSVTRQLVRAGEILGIRVLDHVILGDERYFSFMEEGQMPERDDR